MIVPNFNFPAENSPSKSLIWWWVESTLFLLDKNRFSGHV
jgi:hypothetical protein